MKEKINLDIQPSYILHDELADEIISEQPSKTEKNFLWIIMGCIIILFTTSWFIKYPETLDFPTRLSSDIQPQKIISRHGGIVDSVFESERAFVISNQKLIEFESEANKTQVFSLRNDINNLLKHKTSQISVNAFLKSADKYDNLGKLQFSYLDLILYLKSLLKDKKYRQSNIFETILRFKNKIELWDDSFILRAPINGYLRYAGSISKDKYVGVNQTVAYLVPSEKDMYFTAFLPQSAISKISIGLVAHISLEAYPEKRYGYLVGKIAHIIYLPDSAYKVTIRLSYGMITNQNDIIPANYGLRGTAHIILNNTRLITKITKKLFYKN